MGFFCETNNDYPRRCVSSPTGCITLFENFSHVALLRKREVFLWNSLAGKTILMLCDAYQVSQEVSPFFVDNGIHVGLFCKRKVFSWISLAGKTILILVMRTQDILPFFVDNGIHVGLFCKREGFSSGT